MSTEADLISVAHRDENWLLMHAMFRDVLFHHPHGVHIIPVDNRTENRGFARGCNVGAKEGSAPIIAFINPDAKVNGPFLEQVSNVLSDPRIVITGCRFGKHWRELEIWGLRDWVCGAAMFVRRDFWEEAGGFDERFVWGWEESDLIRRAQEQGKRTLSIALPIEHSSPDIDHPNDVHYKQHHFATGARLFQQKWGLR